MSGFGTVFRECEILFLKLRYRTSCQRLPTGGTDLSDSGISQTLHWQRSCSY